jgi:GTP-binding protein
MIPCDSQDIRKDYNILLNELEKYNPELLDKNRLLAVTKCDMLDQELLADLKKEFPKGIPTVCISSASGLGIQQLKDEIWKAING